MATRKTQDPDPAQQEAGSTSVETFTYRVETEGEQVRVYGSRSGWEGNTLADTETEGKATLRAAYKTFFNEEK